MGNNNLKVLDKQSIKKLLKQRFCQGEKKLCDIPNPALLKDAPKAAKRIARAIKDKQKIAVVGDYDVDGIVSTAIMKDFFKKINYPLQTFIPNRFKDGYGVSPTILKRIDADVIITVDNGITAIEAALICKERGCDLIITDHHTPPQTLPNAYAIVDPKLKECPYPFKEICGAEVAWLVLGLVKKELNIPTLDMRSFVDLLSIAIIADIMPLVDINRTLVKDGLRYLKKSSRPSSIIIRDFLNKSKITAEDIAFQIAPRINSAGRLKDAKIALDFLTAQNTYEAYEKFQELNELNNLRKETEAQTTKEAIEMVKNSDDNIIVVAKEGWHEGVVGIVASRLVDKFQKPAIVLSINDDEAKGSARSLGDINIFELISLNKQYLQKFGGHKMAAGLKLLSENIDSFTKAINNSAKSLPKSAFIEKDEVMGILSADSIDFELLNILESFEPFGEANKRPKFLAKDAKIIDIKRFGADKSHSKIKLKLHPQDKIHHEFILFKQVLDTKKHNTLTCSYSITKNEFNNKISIQLLVNKIYT